jgi:hypothetical protein
VTVRALADAKPLSFTSMRGEITIRLPDASKANIRFRTHRGVILTNFDEKALVTKTVVAHGTPHAAPKPATPASSADVVAPVKGTSSADDSDGDWHSLNSTRSTRQARCPRFRQ